MEDTEDFLVNLLRKLNCIPDSEKRAFHLKQTINSFRKSQNRQLSEDELEEVTAAGLIDLRLSQELNDAVIERQDIIRQLKIAQMQGDLALINQLNARLRHLELEIEAMESGERR